MYPCSALVDVRCSNVPTRNEHSHPLTRFWIRGAPMEERCRQVFDAFDESFRNTCLFEKSRMFIRLFKPTAGPLCKGYISHTVVQAPLRAHSLKHQPQGLVFTCVRQCVPATLLFDLHNRRDDRLRTVRTQSQATTSFAPHHSEQRFGLLKKAK